MEEAPKHLICVHDPDTPLGDTPREGDDYYPRVVVQLSEKWRVINPRQGPGQWVLQRRDGNVAGSEWTSLSFCRSRKALERSIRERTRRKRKDGTYYSEIDVTLELPPFWGMKGYTEADDTVRKMRDKEIEEVERRYDKYL